jgi:Asp-tRNA(Asn)/Glu-tRNA(Gln) amidotransferase A subunit family amidase
MMASPTSEVVKWRKSISEAVSGNLRPCHCPALPEPWSSLAGGISARSYILAQARARTNARDMLTAIKGCHALLMPTAKTLPIPLTDVDETTTPATLTRFVNQLGFCGLAVPNGLSSTGLPTSLQILSAE